MYLLRIAIFAPLASTRLAPILVQEIFSIVEQINKEGVTVLLVEQNVKRTLSISHRAYVLENGRIVLEGLGFRVRKILQTSLRASSKVEQG